MVQSEVAKPRPSGSGIRYEIAKTPLPNGRGSATPCEAEMNLALVFFSPKAPRTLPEPPGQTQFGESRVSQHPAPADVSRECNSRRNYTRAKRVTIIIARASPKSSKDAYVRAASLSDVGVQPTRRKIGPLFLDAPSESFTSECATERPCSRLHSVASVSRYMNPASRHALKSLHTERWRSWLTTLVRQSMPTRSLATAKSWWCHTSYSAAAVVDTR